jgi:hypothetical protein
VNVRRETVASHELKIGDFYLRKKCRSVLRLVVREVAGMPGRRKFRVYDFFVGGGELLDAIWEDRILVWGAYTSEGEARRLVPDLDEKRAKLAREDELKEKLQAARDASQPLARALRGALARLVNACEARDGERGPREYEEALAAARRVLDDADRPLDELITAWTSTRRREWT